MPAMDDAANVKTGLPINPGVTGGWPERLRDRYLQAVVFLFNSDAQTGSRSAV
ncbi:hypothetical protein [uncultured Microbulbifer sp.]|uniref:hypothetical protein n=1 Tax=uncultured Microbulbifer sp. TaxID=348147 RepID=UPI002635F821|nr:hypothetical protein [uncultured Microbulbifer sp.]